MRVRPHSSKGRRRGNVRQRAAAPNGVRDAALAQRRPAVSRKRADDPGAYACDVLLAQRALRRTHDDAQRQRALVGRHLVAFVDVGKACVYAGMRSCGVSDRRIAETQAPTGRRGSCTSGSGAEHGRGLRRVASRVIGAATGHVARPDAGISSTPTPPGPIPAPDVLPARAGAGLAQTGSLAAAFIRVAHSHDPRK